MRTKRLTALAIASLTALAIAAPSALGATATDRMAAPTFTAIGPVDSNVLSMSGDGSVLVGTNIFGGNAFRWTPAGRTQFLGDAGGQVSVSRDGSAIVGDAVFGGHTTAARWAGGTSWASLGRYPGSQGCPDLSNAYAVSNGASTVVGLGWQDCHATAFGWRPGTGMHSLGSLDGQASRGNDVNADGTVVVGWDDAPTGERRGARWVRGQESLLATGTLYLGSAEAVTPDGSVIVGGEAGAGPSHKLAYRWTPTLGGQVLGMLPGGGQLATASGLSLTDDGSVVVGFSGGRQRDAFVWTRATGMLKLQDYLVSLGVQGMDGWRLDTAIAISAGGTSIAGWGYRPDGRVQSWLVRNLPPFPGG
jgi:uncharacterized membrane protein